MKLSIMTPTVFSGDQTCSCKSFSTPSNQPRRDDQPCKRTSQAAVSADRIMAATIIKFLTCSHLARDVHLLEQACVMQRFCHVSGAPLAGGE